ACRRAPWMRSQPAASSDSEAVPFADQFPADSPAEEPRSVTVASLAAPRRPQPVAAMNRDRSCHGKARPTSAAIAAAADKAAGRTRRTADWVLRTDLAEAAVVRHPDMEERGRPGACCGAVAQGPPRRHSLRRRAATAPGSRLRVAAVGRTAPVQAQLQKPPQPGARARKQQKIGSLSTLDGKSAAKTRALIAPG